MLLEYWDTSLSSRYCEITVSTMLSVLEVSHVLKVRLLGEQMNSEHCCMIPRYEKCLGLDGSGSGWWDDRGADFSAQLKSCALAASHVSFVPAAWRFVRNPLRKRCMVELGTSPAAVEWIEI